jgi:hypothetical protein
VYEHDLHAMHMEVPCEWHKKEGIFMDKIIKITTCLFVAILVIFAAAVSYTGFVKLAYTNSLSSTYTYTCTITTDSTLTNVTFFIPVPADRAGNSPIVSQFSAHEITGLPADWKSTLFDTGKSTMVKITTPAIIPPQGTSPTHPFTITITSDRKANSVIDTQKPIENSAMFHPVYNVEMVTCPQEVVATGGSPGCYRYLTSLYADYHASPSASVSIRSSLAGKNSWNIFRPMSNEYHTGISVLMFGDNKGWTTMKGTLESGIGTYDLFTPPVF